MAPKKVVVKVPTGRKDVRLSELVQWDGEPPDHKAELSATAHNVKDGELPPPTFDELIEPTVPVELESAAGSREVGSLDMPLICDAPGGLPGSSKWESVMREQLREIVMNNLLLDAPVWTLAALGKQIMLCVTFHIDEDSVDDVYHFLKANGLGSIFGSVAIYPCDFHRDAKVLQQLKGGGIGLAKASNDETKDLDETLDAQLRLELLIDKIRQDSQLTFDYLTLLVVASLLAGLGLGSNNVVVVIASMLVSPLMGPVLALTFGLDVHDFRLAWLGFVAESLSLLICVLVGWVISVTAGWAIELPDEWPNEQMSSRADIESMPLNIFFAIFSAIGIAVGVVSTNAASMVGTAISASLLPPAVNCGLYWGYISIPAYYNGRNGNELSDSDVLQWFRWGGYSLLLTVVNIACVCVVGILVLRIKQLGPPGDKANSMFWQKDVRLARKLRKSLSPDALKAKLRATFQKKKESETKAGARTLKRQTALSSRQFDETVVGTICEQAERDYNAHGKNSLAGKYKSILTSATKAKKANVEGSEEVVNDLYDLFGRDKKAQAKKRRQIMRKAERRGVSTEVAQAGVHKGFSPVEEGFAEGRETEDADCAVITFSDTAW